MASLCLYSYNSKVRKENYFHISNSLNASIFVAGSECIAFTHLNAYLEALSARASRLGALLSCIWVSGWGGAVSESSIILHQCHTTCGDQWSVSHSGLTAGHQSLVGAMLWAPKVLATGSPLLRPVSSRKLSTFRNILKILVILLTYMATGQRQANRRWRFALYLPKIIVDHLLKSNIGQFRQT